MANCNLCNKKLGMFDDVSCIYDDVYCRECSNELTLKILPDLLSSTTKDELIRKKTNLIEDFRRYNKNYETLKDILEAHEKELLEKIIDKQFKETIDSYIVTTSFNIENYSIEKYLGIASGNSVIGRPLSDFSATINDSFGSNVPLFSEKINTAKQQASNLLTRNSIELGGNALIGVSFSYITFSKDIIGVCATGTSVVIKKTE